MEDSYSRLDFNTLYSLCNKNQWFTCGSIRQYNQLFERNDQGARLSELAAIIWICSAPEFRLNEIYAELIKASEELEARRQI